LTEKAESPQDYVVIAMW